jgi:hypothetical protein
METAGDRRQGQTHAENIRSRDPARDPKRTESCTSEAEQPPHAYDASHEATS